MADETVTTRLEFDAAQALRAMREVQAQAETTAGKAQLLAQRVADYSRSLGVSWRTVLGQMQAVGESTGLKFSTPLGLDVTNAVYKNTRATLENAEAKNKYITADTKAAAATRGFAGEAKNATGQISLFGHSIDAIRTALGTLTAIGIFTVIQVLTEAFQEATKAARELEDSMFRLGNVEKILSQGGADVSLAGLKKGIQDIKKLFPIFSKEDITQLVAQISISTKELGFSEQQILDLAKAVGVLNVRSTEEETASQTAQKVISSLITNNAKGISSLGLSFNETAMRAKGMEMGILAAGESMKDLTNEEKAQIKYQILLENTNGELANMGEYLDTNTAKIKANTAAWHDMLTAWGSLLNIVKPALTDLYGFFEGAANMAKSLYVLVEAGRAIAASLYQAASAGRTVFEIITNLGEAAKYIPDIFNKVGKSLLKNLFPEGMPADAPQWFQNLFGDMFKDIETETPTSPFANMEEELAEDAQSLESAVIDAEEKITEIMAEARDRRAEIDEQYRRKIEDANRDHAQKMQDIARDVARKQEDAIRGYNEKVEDINRDANEKIAEAQADQRQKEIDREKEYQNKLRELRERFLFDLEDALRERDARQVLRLIRQYQLDKKNLEERRKLQRQEDKKDLAEKLAEIERERQLKLEAARRELAEKQAEIALWQQRETEDARIALQRKLADARLWHQRELQEYQQYLQRKLQELAKAIVKEYQLTAAGAQAIYNVLKGYFGQTGSIPNLLAQGLNQNLGNIIGGMGGGTVSPTWGQGGFYGAAEGGTFVATRPTRMLIGERGPEVASITPIGRTGADVNKIFSTTPMGDGGAGGSLSLRVALTEGLVAEIVDSSLDKVAATIEKIGRER